MFQSIATSLIQLLIIVTLAPLLAGFIKKIKALFQNRQGPGLFQLYLDLFKYLQKESVISEHTSWIFRATPYIYLGSILAAALLIPVLTTNGAFNFTGDIILIIYLFALGRFFLTLSGLDAGSAFGGMASSREMALSSIAEPAAMLPLFTMAITAGSANLSVIISNIAKTEAFNLTPAHMISFVAMFIVAIAETGRIPVDNPDTHLELTMIHEGMLLEYSGRPLALMHLGAAIKQLLIFALLANIFFPWGIADSMQISELLTAALAFVGKLILLGLAMAILETSFPKMRLFKVPDLLMGSFLLSLLGLITKFTYRG